MIVTSLGGVAELDLVFSYNAPSPLQISETGEYCIELDGDEEDGGSEAADCPDPGHYSMTQVGALAVLTTSGPSTGAGVAAVAPLTAGVPSGGAFDLQVTGVLAGI